MKAVVWYGRGDVRVGDVPVPRPRCGEVLIEVGACGICRTDVDEYLYGPIFIPVGTPNALTGRAAPIVLGHEFAGEVVALGPGVKSLRIGDRVGAEVLIACGECYWCRRHSPNLCEKLAALGLSGDGGLAEYCCVPEEMCVVLPAGLTLEEAAFAEPLAVAVRAIRRSRLGFGEHVAVVGAGSIGLLAIQVARAAGAAQVIAVDPVQWKRELALKLGAHAVLDPQAAGFSASLRGLVSVGPDVVVEASGSGEAIRLALGQVRKGGRVVLVGIPVGGVGVEPLEVVVGEREVIGCLSHVFDEDYVIAVRLLGEHAVKVAELVSERVDIQRAVEDGLERLISRPSDTMKVIVRPNG